jgi:hypothetical protein
LIATSRPPNGSRARYTGAGRAAADFAQERVFPQLLLQLELHVSLRGAEERRDLLQQLGFLVGLAEELVHAERGGLAAVLLGRYATRS